ncbi:hypothetical protein [Methanoregula sp.]|uniref:hypothetical protein n=1 Tax=Methanoregula sp. TaxID=2052170 RepID=UPI002BDB0AA7|nr:hypothetical protein [Methanoregula sp.]HVP97430.1 hypothetical protein [Methanoregula sp.]
MDELLVPGTIALIVFYAGIVVVAYGIIRVLLWIASAFLSGNYLLFSVILAGIVCAVIAYIIVGLWLRRIEII